MAWVLEPIRRDHARGEFRCTADELNEFLRTQARQNHDLGVSKTYVAVAHAGATEVIGYITVAPASVEAALLPSAITRAYGMHPLPLYRLARMAVSADMVLQGIGTDLLFEAAQITRRAAEAVGGVGLLIDAKDQGLARWYAERGARPLEDQPLTLILTWPDLDTTRGTVAASADAHRVPPPDPAARTAG